MKLNLKAINYKQLALNHAEKAVFGLVLLFGLLAVWGSNWATEKRTPEELSELVTQSRQQLGNATWPDDERQKYSTAIDVRQDVQRMLQPVNVARYEYSEPSEMDWPLYRREDPIKEPQWLALRNLKSDPARTIFAIEAARTDDLLMAGDPAMSPDGNPRPGEGGAQPAVNKEFAGDFIRKNGRGGRDNPGVTGPSAPGRSRGTPADPSADPLLGPGAGAYAGGPGDPGMGMSGGSGITGEGRRFVAVRGVFPLGRQMKLIADALHTTIARVEEDVRFINFELQRKRAVAGADPWAGEWEDVSIESAFELLTKVMDYDEDVVDVSITDPVFTMPLPARVMGEWRDEATHPELKNYELTPEAREQQRALNEQLVKLRRQNEADGRRQPVEPKGFYRLQHDMRQVRQDAMHSPEFGAAIAEAAGVIDPSGNASGRIADDLRQRVSSAAGQLLLFRFFDFEVTPGNAYVYRVRFEVTNPNFQRPAAALENPESAIGETRWTPWSDPSAPSIIEEDVHYYVRGASPGRGRNLPSINMEVFQWFSDSGTVIREDLEVEPGQFVGGMKKTLVLRPAEETFIQEERKFHTDDVLLDVHFGPRFTTADDRLHGDLQLNSQLRATRLGLADQAIVADGSGNVVVIDDRSGESQRQRMTMYVDAQNNAFADLKDQGEDDMAEDDLTGFISPEDADPMAERRNRRRGRRRNSIRKDPMMLMP